MYAFLKQHKASRTNPKNVCSQSGRPYGGKFCIPEERLEEFLRLVQTNEDLLDGIPLVPQAKGRMLQMHVVDLDFDMTEEHVTNFLSTAQ